MSEVNFKATKICPAVIKERCPDRHYRNKTVSFVKLSKTNCDKKTLKDLPNYWNSDANFSGAIYIDYVDEYAKNKSVYLISEQEKDFRKLDPAKILGITTLYKDKTSYKIRYLQTRPDCISNEKAKPYKKIGEALMNNIILITGKTKIYLEALDEVVDFYKRFGFEVIRGNNVLPLMVLKKKK